MFLGNMSNQRQVSIFDPIHDSVNAVLGQRLPEYSTTKQCTLFVGTWNVNGRHPSESLNDWLFPPQSNEGANEPDMYVLGFQEIVPLTAQQIIQTDPEKRLVWEKKILETLDRRPNKTFDYVLLRSEQLVGSALIIVVKSELVPVIRNVEATTRKTGLRGMSGNKGAVGIRLDYHDTNFCFLTGHLAAGHMNVDERNADYRTINENLHFLRGKTIQSHENVIWLADTNYRIELDNYSVRTLVDNHDLDTLLSADQLMKVMDNGQAFVGYEEGPILFRPTYRYDVGTDTYDSSEKMRIPAWTDRILFRGPQLDLAMYNRAELRGSDHRPVYALFRAEVRIVDSAKKAMLSAVLLESVASTQPGERLEERLRTATLPKVVTGDVPPPSSGDSAWWDQPSQPQGIIPLDIFPKLDGTRKSNPFDSPGGSLSASPTSSDEELFTHALSLPTPMVPTHSTRPPPPPPPARQASESESAKSPPHLNGDQA